MDLDHIFKGVECEHLMSDTSSAKHGKQADLLY
jgi:hypothetical protein